MKRSNTWLRNSWGDIKGGWMVIIVAVPVSTFLVLLCVLGNTIGAAKNGDRQNLVLIKDGASTSGQFFLGSGRIEEKNKFFYYRDRGEYSTFESVDAEDSRIFEDTDNDPYIEVSDCFFGWCIYNFHIPKNSIDRSYVLDGEK